MVRGKGGGQGDEKVGMDSRKERWGGKKIRESVRMGGNREKERWMERENRGD